MKLILSGSIENISTRADGTLKFTIGTQEIDPSQAGTLFQMRNKYVKVLVSDTNISEMEERIVDEQHIKDAKKVKSKAQRLRGAMFKAHESQGISISFDDFYNSEMESLIDKYKELI